MVDGEDPDQKNIRDYHLAPKQRDRINNKEALSNASASPGEYLRDIQNNKVENLPERIIRLFSDIRLLAEADFFAEEWESEVWEQVDLSNDNWKEWDWEPHLRELFYEEMNDFAVREPPMSTNERNEESNQSGGPIDFGVEMGHTLRLLCGSYTSTDEQLDLLVGIFVGLMQPGPDTRYPGDESNFNDQSELAEKFKTKLQAWIMMDSLTRQSAGKLQNNYKTREHLIYNSIESENLTPSSPLIEYLLEEADFPPVEDEQTKEDHIQRQKELENLLEKLIEDTKINQVDKLIENISRSISLLVNSESGGEEILSEVYSYDEFSYREINYEGKNLRNMVPLMAGDHEYSDKTDYREWIQNPLIRQVSGNWGQTEWRTTEFGTLVGYVIDEEKSPGWVHNYILEREDLSTKDKKIIEQALSELEL